MIFNNAGLAQLGERQTEDLKVMCSIHISRKCYLFAGLIPTSRVLALTSQPR
ncbi:hypothetical protein BKA56DRAFT_671612 [Ilyonectria sp. MPI-CAGE-AT-0026]|nr:hypothetical protein BKA56DRAFT_671612 [Ilyonectria sp. MPI-CAGE-AT-0026]